MNLAGRILTSAALATVPLVVVRPPRWRTTTSRPW